MSASPKASPARAARASGTAPRRILFVEASIGGVVGGSLTGILHLIDRMDRERFEPALLLYETKVGMERYERAGVRVAVVAAEPERRRELVARAPALVVADLAELARRLLAGREGDASPL